ncbi:MAG: DMT family transporter, partial [Pseudomonadota bacterium]
MLHGNRVRSISSEIKRAYLYAAFAVAAWSTVATAFKLTLATIDIYQTLFYANLVSCLVLLFVLAIRQRLSTLADELVRYWQRSILTALMNPCLYYVILFSAYERLPAQIAQPINYSWSIVLVFLSAIVLGQKVTGRDWLAALICYLGVFIIATHGRIDQFVGADWLGIGLALASTVIWAGYWTASMRDRRATDSALAACFLLALPMTGALCFTLSNLTISITGFIGAAYIGLFEMSLAFLAWGTALRLTDRTARISNLIFLSPFVSLLLIHLILGETIHVTTGIGLVLIVVALYFQQRGSSSRVGRDRSHNVLGACALSTLAIVVATGGPSSTNSVG